MTEWSTNLMESDCRFEQTPKNDGFDWAVIAIFAVIVAIRIGLFFLKYRKS